MKNNQDPIHYTITRGRSHWEPPLRVRAVFSETEKSVVIGNLIELTDGVPTWESRPSREMREPGVNPGLKLKTFEEARVPCAAAIVAYNDHQDAVTKARDALAEAISAQEAAVKAVLKDEA